MKLDVAISIVAKAFEGKYDKSGEPYILHCLQVMNNVEKWDDDELRVIAVLHDLIEDTGWELFYKDSDTCAIELNNAVDDFILINKRVYNSLKLLTHIKGVPYDDYIQLICTNQDAVRVKMADIEHNSSILRLKGIRDKDLERIAKYHKAYLSLKRCLV